MNNLVTGGRFPSLRLIVPLAWDGAWRIAPPRGHETLTQETMKPALNGNARRTAAGLIALVLAAPGLHAGLVGQWRGTDYVDYENWTSTAGTGGIVANVVGSPVATDIDYASGTKAVSLDGYSYFVVPAASNPLAGATGMTLVAIFRPSGAGTMGAGFNNGSGLIGMEQDGVANDWGLGWNGNRIGAAACSVGVVERTAFTDPLPTNTLRVAMFTWNSTGVQQVFVNGVLISSQDTGATTPRNPGDFALGAISSAGANPFYGEIAELRVYDTDESAGAAAIASELWDTYAATCLLDEGGLNPTGGRIVLIDTAAAAVDPAGAFTLYIGGAEIPSAAMQVSKTGGRTTITVTAPPDHGQSYYCDLTVPLVGGGVTYFSETLPTHKLPLVLPGPEGGVGSWGIREVLTGAAPMPADVADIATAVTAVLANPASAEGTAPVFNHCDPDTNGADAMGNFNNDFNILSNSAGDQDWIVVAKTQVEIASPGEVHTFGVHTDDGFAMRVTGPGGGRFIGVGGNSQVDPGDVQTLFVDGGQSDSNARGTYRFDAAGTYSITCLSWDGGGGGFQEVAWAPGQHFDDRDTNQWRLVGNDTDPSIPALRERFVANPPGPPAGTGTFGVRTFLTSTGVTNLATTSTFLETTTRTPDSDPYYTFDAQLPFLNHRDPNNGNIHRFTDDQPIPGDTAADDENVVTVARGRIDVPAAGTYTFITIADDGFILRLKGVGGDPDPSFRRVTSPVLDPRFQMSNPNEVFYDGANQEVRCIVDLPAGPCDIEYITVENAGACNYELGIAAGEWPHVSTPPDDFQLVGLPPATVVYPAVAAPGWSVEASIAGMIGVNNVSQAEFSINYTQSLPESDPMWASYGLNPADRLTTWPALDFDDPQAGGAGSYAPTNPWPLNTPNADDYFALRATGILDIPQAGYYHLGFQGDDGGYLFIYGVAPNADPDIESIVLTNLGAGAVIGSAPGSTALNAIRADVPTGNSLTIVRVHLEAGQYQIKTLFFEIDGGAWWEVFGRSADGYTAYRLLSTTGGSTSVGSGLALLEQPAFDPNDPNFKLRNIVLTGTPVASVAFDIGTQAGASYTVQASTDLMTWIDLDTNVVAAGTLTPFAVNLADFPALNGQPKLFFRALFNE